MPAHNTTMGHNNNHLYTGFRLYYLEVWNWGTFHRKIWRMLPSGHTCLLTGANGSGKSTLADALLTLLVPNNKRNYNQASGAERRRERDERTYVLGAYGKIKSEESYTSKTQYLRGNDDYSVILACFYNEARDQYVTLAQVFWLQESEINKFFVVARERLEIKQHFSEFASIQELRKRLERLENVRVLDRFSSYSNLFRKFFNLRSDKALDLFNQTVAIKEIGELNGFVRTHMLEKADFEARISELRQNFENLTRSYEAMRKAEEQRNKLRPLLEEAADFARISLELSEFEQCLDAVPDYFARRAIAILEQAAAQAEAELVQARINLEKIDSELDGLAEAQRSLDIAISTDETGQRIWQLDEQIKHLNERIRDRQRQESKYSQLARSLNFPPYTDEQTFAMFRTKASEQLPSLATGLQKAGDERVRLQVQKRTLEERGTELTSELESLRQRSSQIPHQSLQLRSRILSDLGINEEDIPFVGELLQVRPEARDWEGAIERLLHSFGLCLLVSEQHYRSFSQYVSHTNLQGRIVFLRVNPHQSSAARRRLDSDSVIYKLEIKPDTPFHSWLRNELIERFDYICCEDMSRFQQESYAITMSGLIKGGKVRHEKDDRRALNDRRNYILGWNNYNKIQALESELTEVVQNLRAVGETIATIEKDRTQREQQQQRLNQFLAFDDFSLIDWKTEEHNREALEAQKQELQSSSDRLQQLQAQRDEIKQQIQAVQQVFAAAQRSTHNVERDIADYQKQRADCETRRRNFAPETVEFYAERIGSRCTRESGTQADLTALERQVQRSYQQSIREAQDRLVELRSSIEQAMTNYKRDYPTETADVDASVRAIDDFAQMLEVIEREDLPRHTQRFKALLNEKIVDDISMFQSRLEQQVDEIQHSIATLNISLRTIDYTPTTFIQLESEPNRDADIQEFKRMLRECFPDSGQLEPAEEANETSFHKIKTLIERFDTEERWTAKVTDVRNWLNFSASEKDKIDETVKQYYSDSSGKSGGQKVKLAYTILASAIAYQFGLDHEQHADESFRFVVIDEAFSKTDLTNARYAMELFKHLGLQLLVVTPQDKIHVVQPYIGACHLVTNNQEGNDSHVYNVEREVLFTASEATMPVLDYDYSF